MTTTTELHPLTRTLTDMLDDELMHMSANMGQDTINTPKSWKNRSLEDLMVAPDHASTSLYETEERKQSMFSKYADPSLTTMSFQKPSSHSRNVPGPPSSLTPVQATVSLNKVMNINPFVARLPSATTPEVRISSPALFQGEDEDMMMNTGPDSFPPDLYDDYSGHQKMFSWPLQDSATLSQDAMFLFDREFGNDLSDEEEDDDDECEYNCNDRDCTHIHHPAPPLQDDSIDSYPQTENPEDDSLIFDRSRPGAKFVDDHPNDKVIIEDDDDEDEDAVVLSESSGARGGNMVKGLLYDHRRSSMVCLDDQFNSAPSSAHISREPSLPADPAHLSSSSFNISSPVSLSSLPAIGRKKKYPGRRKSCTAASSTPTLKKKASPLTAPSSASAGNSNEVHTCELINPITNEVCGKKFSRPYDLIRHQKTIHASKKKVFRCVICIQQQGAEGYEKTFSRGDALSRHIKVKHDLTGAEAQKAMQFAKENVEYAHG
ncbi:LAME_0G06106g1_1 [Lachancea meyersii CBS 8951]|uniref:LAME_0G06106g1_1 n=1 Tax=Lachancea meyersii CBS 8951 TaxID=1266667 RepID=A0A1G4K7J3_9SACH|nr:LAME_0G06106g1_1 [Lachancea meyersii CBS 8951]